MTGRCVVRTVAVVLAFALSFGTWCAQAQITRLPTPPPPWVEQSSPSPELLPQILAPSPFDRELSAGNSSGIPADVSSGILRGTSRATYLSDSVVEAPIGAPGDAWTLQLLPDGLMYHSYLAGPKEARLATMMIHDDRLGWVWDHNIGARVGAFRFGTQDEMRPEGWQLDVEASTYLRQDMEDELDVVASDFRVGIPLTYAHGPIHVKVSYYHTSSHVGDEFQLKNPTFQRINYLRDALTFGVGYYVTDSLRVYAEADWAFNRNGGADPVAFQFGGEYSPRVYNGFRGAPFFAINGHVREELNFSGSLNVQTGWQWRSKNSQRLLRVGVRYFNGATPLYEFFDRTEELIGFGIWYDF